MPALHTPCAASLVNMQLQTGHRWVDVATVHLAYSSCCCLLNASCLSCAGLPFAGNLPGIVYSDIANYMEAGEKKYGKVFKVRGSCSSRFTNEDESMMHQLRYTAAGVPQNCSGEWALLRSGVCPFLQHDVGVSRVRMV